MAKAADGNRCEIRDLVTDYHQQTFLLAQQKLHQLREPEKAKSWLFTITRTLYLKVLRKRTPALAGDIELDLGSWQDEIPHQDDFDVELLQNAVSELPEPFRLVLLMFYFEELSYKQIADQLELPPGTVMSRLARAKSHLRQKLISAEDTHSKQTSKA